MTLPEDLIAWAFRIPGRAMDEVSDALTIAGTETRGLTEEDGATTVWTDGDDVPMPFEGTWRRVDPEDWVERWKESLEPVTVGRVTIAPPWHAPDGPVLRGDGPLTIVIEPGLAFGTGHHDTTAGCLDALQDVDLAGRRVLDVGTGTGVLAIAAAALGAAHVTGIDIDPQAIDVARENLAAHAEVAAIIDLQVATPAAVTVGSDVVIANIITDLLLALVDDLARLTAPDGVLITSGVAVERTDEALARFASAGLTMTATPRGEWALLVGGHG